MEKAKPTFDSVEAEKEIEEMKEKLRKDCVGTVAYHSYLLGKSPQTGILIFKFKYKHTYML